MPELTERDPEQLAATLTSWLGSVLDAGAEPEVLEVNAPASSGFSNETILASARWNEAGERAEHRLVFRVHPTQHTLFLDANFSHQYEVLKALQGVEGLPVPALRFYEEDTSYLGVPFFVMDHVEGSVPADNPPYTMEGWLLESSPEDQARLWWTGIETLAAVHQLDWEARGLGFLSENLRGEPGLDHLLNYYRAFLDTAANGRPQPTTEAIWDWLVANRPEESGPIVLSWGDSRIGNIIWDDRYEPAAVLDWEMAALGQAELDLGWWLYFDRQFSEGLNMPRPAGFPPHEETIARYEELLGRPMENLFWYQVFAGFRFAVIMCRLSDLLMGTGVLPEDSDMGTNNLATQFTAQLLGLPSPAEAAEVSN